MIVYRKLNESSPAQVDSTIAKAILKFPDAPRKYKRNIPAESFKEGFSHLFRILLLSLESEVMIYDSLS